MAKFMIIHQLPEGTNSKDVEQVIKAAQEQKTVKGYRSFINISQGKAVCVYEADDKQAIADWFTKNSLPFESITQLELEEERGIVHKV